ncbi:MAG: type I secretion system permease/ATPase [Rickettsiales bacterium]|nr:type I secretion system permease/ATPase [Rickettsiales bacterium]
MENQQQLITSALKDCKRAFIFCFLFSFFISIFNLASSIYSMQVLNRVLASNSFETLFYLTVITVIFLAFLGVITQIRTMIFVQIANWLEEKLSPALFNSVIESGNSNKNINSQNIRDLQSLKNFIAGPNLATIFDFPFALVYLIMIFFIHPINGLITIAGCLMMLKMAYINEKSTKNLIEKTNQMQIDVVRNFEIIFSNSEVINAMGMKKNVHKTWQVGNDELRKSLSDLSIISGRISAISSALRMVLQILTMASSALLVMMNKMSSGGIIATSILSSKALSPFDNAISMWKSLRTIKSSYVRLNDSLKNYVEDKKKIELPKPQGEITVDKLIYKLTNSDLFLIKNISFQIKPGEIIGIIGSSGSGKTTLARLLTGVLKPTSGIIRIDGADISHQDLEKIGKYIGYLPQDVELFQGSVKENIARMNKEIKDEDIIKAAQFCDVHETILALPQGYETIIEKDGSNLSAGQRQRIALARAYFGEAKFVVLDEPNSNLDNIGEQALNKTILNAKAQKITTIIITHRNSAISICDKIMILGDGELKAFGSTNEILARTGIKA